MPNDGVSIKRSYFDNGTPSTHRHSDDVCQLLYPVIYCSEARTCYYVMAEKKQWGLNNISSYTESSQMQSLVASAASVYEFELIGFACRLTFPLKRPAATFTTWHKEKRRVGFCSLITMMSHAILWTTLLVCIFNLCKQVSIWCITA